MRANEVVFFCAVYLLFFFMIGSLAGITTFPPPAQMVKISIWEIQYVFFLSFWDMTLLVGAVAFIVGLTFLAGIKIFGSGITFDQSFVATISIAIFVGGMLAWNLNSMLIDVPLHVSAVLVWPFVGVLMYSIVSMARGGGG